ncbi:MAG: hypothetical protein RIE53_07750 [Rhodothermales bacterium]
MNTAFDNLLARYLNGQIGERVWSRLMRTFDFSGMSTHEREAYLRFMNDVAPEGGLQLKYVPRTAELSNILQDIRF